MVEEVCTLPGSCHNSPLSLLLPLLFRLRPVFSMVVLAPQGEVAKALPVVRLGKKQTP